MQEAEKMAELIGLHYSPWTEKAKWALDHHELPYSYSEHLLMLGMPSLRMKTRRFTGDVTVPAYIDQGTRLIDSYEIAKFADTRRTKAGPLFPEGAQEAIDSFNVMSEEALDAGRALMVDRLAAHREAKLETLPSFVPAALRPVMLPVVSVGIGYINHEFKIDRSKAERDRLRLLGVLEGLRAKLAGRDYLLGDFSYADITMSAVLQFVSPVVNPRVKLGQGLRQILTDIALQREFSDLVNWRDSLYKRHR